MTFGEKLQLLRKSKGWTQEQLAAQIGISRQALSKWESDTAMPDTENVVRLSRLFAVSTDYLLLDDYDTQPPQSPQVPSPGSNRPSAHLIRLIAGGAASGLSVVILLVLGVLSSIYPLRLLYFACRSGMDQGLYRSVGISQNPSSGMVFLAVVRRSGGWCLRNGVRPAVAKAPAALDSDKIKTKIMQDKTVRRKNLTV